ncbi:UNVERIFIED_CONTAM: hypothetical protein FKN15_066724 [Acipenser sinensis]
MSGQTLTDRIAAAQYSVTGSAVARAVCKATTHEVMGPKKKHLDYLIQATNETNVNIPQMADTLFERATNSSWVVVFKALVTTHHLMVQGNEQVGIDKGDIPDLTYVLHPGIIIDIKESDTDSENSAFKDCNIDDPVILFDSVSYSPDLNVMGYASNNLLDLQPDFSSAQPAGAAAAPAASSAWGVDAFSAPSAAPAAASPAKPDTAGVLDLFGDAFGGSSAEPQPATAASSADLLSGLGGAFMVPSPATASPAPAQNNLMQPSFDAAFGTTPTATSSGFDSSVFDGLEDLLMPTMTPQGQGAGAGLGGIAGVQSGKALAGDLNSSLANLAGNLGIAGTQKKDLQWNAGERKLTGGVNWQPKVAPATWGTPGSQMTGAVPPGGVPPVGGVTPVAAAPPVGAIPPMGAVQPQPGFGMPPAAGAGAPMMPQSSMMYPQPMMRPPFGASASPGAPLSPSPTPATQSPKKPPTKDPLADLNIKDFL